MKLLPFAVLAIVVSVSQVQAQEIEPEDLKPGLIATFGDNNARHDTATRLEPVPAISLAADEAPHPKLSATGGEYVWNGYIKILRNGEYTFSARLRGEVTVRIGDNVVLSAKSIEPEAAVKTGEKVTLKAGIHPFRVNFARYPGKGKLELLWKIPQTRLETIPHEQLGHILKDRNVTFKKDTLAEHGRFVFEESACIKCHKSEKKNQAVVDRQGPNLTQIGSRVHPGWIEAWLADPQKLRPGTRMPKSFGDDETAKLEIYAVAKYLSSLGGPMPGEVKTKFNPAQINKGRTLFTTIGCAACHNDTKDVVKDSPTVYGLMSETGSRASYPLGALGSKTRSDKLAAYLQNPHANNPTSRMPSLNLSGEEARDLSLYLTSIKDDKIPQDLAKMTEKPPPYIVERVMKLSDVTMQDIEAYSKLDVDKKWIDIGKKLVSITGCVNCHVITPNNQTLPTLATKSLEAIQKNPKAGCMSEKPTGVSPLFPMSKIDREGLAEFLTGYDRNVSKAPAHAALISFKRFQCLNCHQRDGEGGLSTELVDQMQKLEKAQNLDDIRPPVLTGVGHKLLTPWFKKVLTQSGRARPWMSLRMPQYGEANVGTLAEGITFLEGADLDEKVHQVDVTPTKVEGGRLMVGKTGLGCISCHDIAGIPNTGTRGPDLASTNQRVRYDWYRNWLEQPQRMVPNTRMPQIFIDGKSLFQNAFGGDPDKQAEGMWAYMSLGSKLPLPAGLEPPKGLVVRADREATILRTFMPEAGNRAIAVGFPEGVNFAFDANQCRVSYGWAGNFLDASPVWDNRGGAPAKLLGPKFWSAPPGNPWSIAGSQEPPDFVKRADNPAFGKPLPDLQLFKETRRVFFDGYSLDEKGVPTFRYRVLSDSDATLNVTEKVEPVKNSIATGLTRNFSLQIPASQASYLFAGDSSKEPRLFDRQGVEVPLDLKSGATEQEATDRMLIIPAEGESATVLAVSQTFEGVKWRLQPRTGGGWLALVKIPMTKAETKGQLSLHVWSVGRVDASFLKGLNGK